MVGVGWGEEIAPHEDSPDEGRIPLKLGCGEPTWALERPGWACAGGGLMTSAGGRAPAQGRGVCGPQGAALAPWAPCAARGVSTSALWLLARSPGPGEGRRSAMRGGWGSSSAVGLPSRRQRGSLPLLQLGNSWVLAWPRSMAVLAAVGNHLWAQMRTAVCQCCSHSPV